MQDLHRRDFLEGTAASLAGASAARYESVGAPPPNILHRGRQPSCAGQVISTPLRSDAGFFGAT